MGTLFLPHSHVLHSDISTSPVHYISQRNTHSNSYLLHCLLDYGTIQTTDIAIDLQHLTWRTKLGEFWGGVLFRGLIIRGFGIGSSVLSRTRDGTVRHNKGNICELVYKLVSGIRQDDRYHLQASSSQFFTPYSAY